MAERPEINFISFLLPHHQQRHTGTRWNIVQIKRKFNLHALSSKTLWDLARNNTVQYGELDGATGGMDLVVVQNYMNWSSGDISIQALGSAPSLMSVLEACVSIPWVLALMKFGFCWSCASFLLRSVFEKVRAPTKFFAVAVLFVKWSLL